MKNPKQRIALLATSLTNPAYEGKVMGSILCTRKCCQVVFQGGKNKSNIELIKEYLCNGDADSRKNAAVIAKNIFSKKNVNTVIRSYSFMSNSSSLLEAIVKNESLKNEAKNIIEDIFSKENMKNEELLDHLLSLLKAMVKNESLKDEAGDIIENIFSKENIGTVLKSEIFMYNLPSLLKSMTDNGDFKGKVKHIIKVLLSKENIGTVLESETFMSNLPSLLKAMFENESFEDDVKYIIKNLFSKENIGAVLKNYWFVMKLPSLLKDMIENESFKEEVKYIIKNMFLSNMSSNKNLGKVLGSVDFLLGRLESATGNIIKGLAKEMLEKEYKDFEKKAPNIVKNLISSKNIMPELSSSSTQKEMLNRENSSVRDGISSLKSIMHMFDSSFAQKRMLNYGNKTEEDYRNKTEDSASDFIRNILGNDSVPEELKSELKALLDNFSAKRREFIPQELIKKEEKAYNRKLAVLLRK